ncbi:MAG: orotidine-5'-phosphate decarboxylase [Nitrospirae bacterium]|nr:orotidine-5'-phosphate decarboxylase [Nitrospirota bacterium]
MKAIDAKERLIVALDLPTVEEAKRLVRHLDGLVSFFKIGLELQLVAGLDFVKWLIQDEKKVFLDYKYFDVEETIRRAVAQVAAIGVNFLTVHGSGGIIRAAVEGRGQSELKLLAVTVLTSLDALDIRDLGFECAVEDLVLYRARKAMEAGCDGVITSGHEARAIRELAKDRLLIVTPGIRPEGATRNEHKRSVTPTQAIQAGADYLVVGRPIRDAKDHRMAAEQILVDMQSAFERRQRL